MKVKVMDIQNLHKWLISKSVSCASMQVIKRRMRNYDTPRQYVNCNLTDFWHSSSFTVTWHFNLWQMNFPFMRCWLAVNSQQGLFIC